MALKQRAPVNLGIHSEYELNRLLGKPFVYENLRKIDGRKIMYQPTRTTP